MGVYIPNMEKPKSCWECFNANCDHWGEHGYDNSTDCPLIDIIPCKECIHSHDRDCPIDWALTENDFCSYAERK